MKNGKNDMNTNAALAGDTASAAASVFTIVFTMVSAEAAEEAAAPAAACFLQIALDQVEHVCQQHVCQFHVSSSFFISSSLIFLSPSPYFDHEAYSICALVGI